MSCLFYVLKCELSSDARANLLVPWAMVLGMTPGVKRITDGHCLMLTLGGCPTYREPPRPRIPALSHQRVHRVLRFVVRREVSLSGAQQESQSVVVEFAVAVPD